MRIFGNNSRNRAAKKRKNNATWNNFNRNLTSWNSTGVSSRDTKVYSRSDIVAADRNRKSDNSRIVKSNKKVASIPNDSAEQNFTFRRNATLSNLQSEHREKTERQRERALRLRRRQLGVLLAIVAGVCLIGLLVLSQFSGSFIISSENAKLTSAQDAYYTNILNQYFAKNPFERFSFGRRDSNLSEFIESKAPEVGSVQMNASGLGGGMLHLSFRKPVAMWKSGGDTNFVDSNGVVFSKSFFANPSVTITDDSGVSISGQTTSSGFLSFIGQVSADLTKGDQNLQRVVIPRGAIRYCNIYLQGRSYPFMVQIDRDPSSQSADIIASVKYIDQNHISPQYVDVRVSGKMYWK